MPKYRHCCAGLLAVTLFFLTVDTVYVRYNFHIMEFEFDATKSGG